MRTFFGVSLLATLFAPALGEKIEPAVALIDLSEEDKDLLVTGQIGTKDIIEEGTSDITLVPEPLAETNLEAEKPPGKWTDEQKLTLETFKEIVATDLENVWVVAYIDPRCRDCLVLSLEWEKLTQIEEREKRKIKLGYVDISVEENWKIIQDHTKGRKMTATPAVTLYGQNKKKPYWYNKENHPSANGVHKWVSSYADYYGYGYWDPEKYNGPGASSHHPHDPVNRQNYGIGKREHIDSRYHDGALGKFGVRTGAGKKGYLTDGKWQKGDQVTQVKADKDQTIMRRRTITQGGSLSGAAHHAAKDRVDGAGLTYQQRLALAKKQAARGVGLGGYGSYYGSGDYGYDIKGLYHPSVYKPKGKGIYTGNSAYQKWLTGKGYQTTAYGRQQHGYGRQQHGYGRNGYNNGYGRTYGGRQAYNARQPYRRGYGSAPYSGRQAYGQYGQRQAYGKGYGGAYGSRQAYGQYGYGRVPQKQHAPYSTKGRYGDPNTRYYGPGSQYLLKAAQQFKQFYDPVLGKGIVLGKYTKKLGDSKKVSDYDIKDIAGPDSQAYQDAMKIAQQSGKGETDIFLPPQEMVAAVIKEDIAQAPAMLQKQHVIVPEAPNVAAAPTVEEVKHSTEAAKSLSITNSLPIAIVASPDTVKH